MENRIEQKAKEEFEKWFDGLNLKTEECISLGMAYLAGYKQAWENRIIG